MKTPRLAAAIAVGALAAASTLFLGAGAANALPSGITNPVGTVTPTTSGSTLTLTQTTDIAVVNITALTLLAGETLDIVQDEGDVLIIRNTGAIPAGFEGTLTADATVIITSPLGIGVLATGSLTAGEDLILTTGAITDAGAQLATIPIDPTDGDGILGTAVGASLTGETVGMVGDYVVHGGFVDALDGFAMLLSLDATSYTAAAVPQLAIVGAGLAAGGVAMTGSIYANGAAAIVAPAPGGMSVTGSVVSNGQGSTFEVAQNLLLGAGQSLDLTAQAYGNIDDPIGVQFPASAMTGSSVPTFWTSLALVVDGDTAPTTSVFFATDFALGDDDGYTFPSIQAFCEVEDGVREATVALPGGASLIGTPLTPLGYDFNIPNQPPIPVGEFGFISFNEQVHTTVGGWDVLTITAVHLVGENGFDARIGVVSCAVPAQAQLAATGSVTDLAPTLAGAGAIMLGGVVLVLRRRRSRV